MTGFLLVGGQGRRMGGAKATRIFDGRPLWSHGHDLLSQCCSQVVVLGHCPELELPALVEETPGQGPLGGVVCALNHSSTPWNLVLALDYPLLTADMVARLRPPRGLACLPSCQGQAHPLCGYYHRAAAAPLGEALAAGQRSLLRAVEGLGEQVHWVDFEDERAFLNVNHLSDLR